MEQFRIREAYSLMSVEARGVKSASLQSSPPSDIWVRSILASLIFGQLQETLGIP
jgi:hypothetical protein